MARVRVVGQVRIGKKTLPVKKVPNLAPILAKKDRGAPEVMRSTVSATVDQLRVLAEESRELVLDRLFAARAQAPASIVVTRPARVAPSIKTASRAPYRHRALTQKWVQRKARDSQDGRKLIATGDYAQGIEVFKGKQASGVYFIVRPADRKHVPSGLRLPMLARVHEFGSAKHKIPPRPHWGPAVRDVRDAFAGARPTIRAEAARRLLRRIG
jgi:hypothetical protein